jgi:hypothetical protein
LTKARPYPPSPPDYDWSCITKQQQLAAVEKYPQKLIGKELKFQTQLINAVQEMTSVGADMSPSPNDAFCPLVAQEIYPKVQFLFDYFNDDYKKFYAVALAANVTMNEFDTYVVPPESWQEAIQAWGLSVYNELLDELCHQHKYSVSKGIYDLAQELAVLAMQPGTQDAIDQLKKALMFKLSVDMSFTYSSWDSEGDLTDDVTEETKGEVDNLLGAVNPPLDFVSSTNSIPIVSGNWTDNTDNCTYSLDPGQSRPWGPITLHLYPCGESTQVFFYIGGPLLPFETWTGCNKVSIPDPWLGIVWADIQCNAEEQGLFMYPSLPDGVAEIVNDTVTGNIASTPCYDGLEASSGTVHIVLDHTPQQ